MIQYYLNRKFLSIKLSRNTAKLYFMVVHLKSSMEAFFKKIFFKTRNCQVLHISVDLKTKESRTLMHIKSPNLTSSKARQSIRQLELVNRDLRWKIVFSLIDFPRKDYWFWICFCFYLGGPVWEKHFQNKLTKFWFFLFHVDPVDQILNLFLLSILLLSQKRV